MKDAMYLIGFVLILAGGAMADSASLVPTILCVSFGALFVIVANDHFRQE